MENENLAVAKTKSEIDIHIDDISTSECIFS